jgi:hypothetical protein
VESIAQVNGGDVATLLMQYETQEIAEVALRAFEEELAYAEQETTERIIEEYKYGNH